MPQAKSLKKKWNKSVAENLSKEHQVSVEAGFYSKKREGVIDSNLKVLELFETISGRAPWKAMIDWKKKLYASLTINNLLREEGVVYSKENIRASLWSLSMTTASISVHLRSGL